MISHQEMSTESRYSHTHATTHTTVDFLQKTTPHSGLNAAVTSMNTVYIVDSCQCSKLIVTQSS